MTQDLVTQTTQDNETDTNTVCLSGKLAAAPEVRELPSGDVLYTFRLVVRRPSGARGTVDSIDCVTSRKRLHRRLARAAPGDRLAVEGALRRRFWRGATGVQSRYAVDVESLQWLRD